MLTVKQLNDPFYNLSKIFFRWKYQYDFLPKNVLTEKLFNNPFNDLLKIIF